MVSPKGPRSGRLYKFPKVHKENVPLRSLLPVVGTFNYGL
ncbi:unnamed protein product, partial [Rotaria sordida]